jgi:phenylalanyl-tRNA synthetase beta chain
LVAAFSLYCEEPFTVEEVEIYYQETQKTEITPDLKLREFDLSLASVKRSGSIDVTVEQAQQLLQRMEHEVKIVDKDRLHVVVPITRPGKPKRK